jgi:histidinol-phosphate aminotransferase
VKLNQNEGLDDLPDVIKQKVLARLARVDFQRYPPFDPEPLLEEITRADGWRKDGILVGNGSNELLTLLFRSVVGAGERVVRPQPCFSLYPLHLDVLGAVQVPVTLKLDDDFAFAEDVLVERSRAAKVVLLGSPNNPTASVVSPRVVKRLLEETRALVVVDEAYRQFAHQDFVPLLERSGRVVLLRTFSKAMGHAGLRFGYLLGHPALVEELHKVALPYNVSTLTQEAVHVLLEHPEVQRDFVAPPSRSARASRPRCARRAAVSSRTAPTSCS